MTGFLAMIGGKHAGLVQLRARPVSQRSEIRRQRQENGLENR